MQAVILAAGMGSRLGKYTSNATKCMLEVDGKTLLERILDSLRKVHIHDVVIVTGYCAEKLVDHARAVGSDFNIRFIHNEKYSVTNNIYSLYLASEYMAQDDTVLFESDLIFDPSIVSDIVNSPYPDIVTVSRFENWMDGTVTTFDKDNNVTAFIDKANFRWDECSSYYKTVNIYKISKEFFVNWYQPFLEAYIKTCGSNAYYEMVLKVIANINAASLKALDITGKLWYEIDTPQDLQTAETLFGSNKLENLSKRYGGYWRFNGLHDYCYLVNPWFPTKSMLDEIKFSFDMLISQYPSGRNVISTAMAGMLEISEEKLAVGNGASELIRTLIKGLKGSCYITAPSFEEYINSSDDIDFNKVSCSSNKFGYGSDLIISGSADSDTVIVINPDNPSGNFIEKEEMLHMLDIFLERGQKVIIDESFVDFAAPSLRYTLIDNNILDKYPNLCVIKSISKSYGIPGIRLGALCSSDIGLVNRIKEALPIWNINSFAKCFLQIFGKYKKDYICACDRIAEERHDRMAKLKNTGKLEVYPSQANYVMCRLLSETAEALSEYLLKNNYLIKNLKNKHGCDDGEYIRIAVRTT